MKAPALVFMAIAQSALLAASYPVSQNVVDVTKPPYSAKADGVSDDTEALQRAINEHTGRHRILYFPGGTYLVSATLKWPKKFGGRDKWGKTFLCGESRETCTIRLMDGTFTDDRKPEPIMWCGGFGSADWFHNYIQNLTFDVGAGNPGAVALALAHALAKDATQTVPGVVGVREGNAGTLGYPPLTPDGLAGIPKNAGSNATTVNGNSGSNSGTAACSSCCCASSLPALSNP